MNKNSVASVGDSDPDPDVFGPPGSGSGGTDLASNPDPSVIKQN